MGANFPVNATEENNHMSLAGRFLDAAHIFNQIYTPLLCLFGALGNCVSVTVFCKTSRHRNLSSSFYLSALAISDTGFLFSLLAVWLEDMGLHVITTPLSCPLVMYLGQVTCFLSVWFIVAFTMERFFAVCYPLTRPTVCTVARAKRIILGLTIFALLSFSYVWVIATVLDFPVERFLVTTTSYEDEQRGKLNGTAVLLGESGSSEDMGSNNGTAAPIPPIDLITVCSVRQQHLYFSSIASHIDSVLTLILPFGIISYLNIRIALCVWRLRDQRDSLVAVAKISRQNSNSTRTQVGFVYRSSMRNNNVTTTTTTNGRSHSVNHLNLGHPGNFRSRTNLTVDFDVSDGSSTSTVAHCCALDHHVQQQQQQQGQRRRHKSKKKGRKRVNNSSTSSHSRAETRVTKTLLLVSTVFLVLNLPSHAIRAATFIQSFWSLNIHQESLFAAQQWSNILFNMNFSVNFLLYCVSGKNFRGAVKKIFCRIASGGRSEAHRFPKSNNRVASPITATHSPVLENSSLHPTTASHLYPPSITEMETYA